MTQQELFTTDVSLPPGMIYRAEFITVAEEASLLKEIHALPLEEAKYKQFTAKRRIISYGGSYDFSSNQLLPASPLPLFLHPLRAQIAQWIGVADSQFVHALIAEYTPGTQLGWHRDVPEFEIVVGVSLGAPCRLRLRPYPPEKGRRDSQSVDLEPRSAYVLRGVARWGFSTASLPQKLCAIPLRFERAHGKQNCRIDGHGASNLEGHP